MPQPSPNNVVAHWSKLIEGLSTSPVEFYEQVESGLRRRQIPGLKTSKVEWNEGGILAPRRQYLRVLGQHHVFDMCAAHFGTGFFFSSWVTRRKARFVFFQLLAFAAASALIWLMLLRGLGETWRYAAFLGPLVSLISAPLLLPISALLLLWLIAVLARSGTTEPEIAILSLPGLGWIYERIFAPETYYRIDTMLMFQSAVHAAMMEAIDSQTTQKGVRGLSEDERKPIFHRLT